MKLIGLDISTRITGYSIYVDKELTESGTIDLHKMKNTEERQVYMANNILSLLEKYKPDVVYVEDTFVKGNVETSMKLMMMIGSVFGWCSFNDVVFHKIKPSAWRSTIGISIGNKSRNELKDADIEYVLNKYGVECTDDEADAIGIGEAGVMIIYGT